MNCLRTNSVKMSVLAWLISTALFAAGASGQFRYQSTWLLLRQEQAKPRLFDEYGNLRYNDEKARLDVFASELQNDPGAEGYIIGYGGSICRAGEAVGRAGRAADYLINTRGISEARIITQDGGYRNEVGAELYIVPLGASKPVARPSLSRCKKPVPVSNRGRRGHSR